MNNRNRVVYARITALNFEERAIEVIVGRIQSGSVNVDGASAVRRTCSLSLMAPSGKISEYLWVYNTKFKLEVGLEQENGIKWYKQGTYILTSFSVSYSTNNCTISLQGKDKMCLLNGENGGTLPFEVDFGQYEEIDTDGNIRLIQNPLKDIIREAVHHYGSEAFHNIIINDLDDRGVELQEYRYDTPLYLFRQKDQMLYEQGTLNGKMEVSVNGVTTTLDSLEVYDSLIGSDFTEVNQTSTVFTLGGKEYQAAKIIYGQTMGYIATEMYYNGDLIASAGSSVTSMLDNITKMLGNFEYFYDLDGRFIFQEKKNYINTSWTPLTTTDEGLIYLDPMSEKVQYEFINHELFTAFNNNPQINNVKNDFSVWGNKKNSSGSTVKIHMRYAIDEKPWEYNSIEVSDEDLEAYNKKFGLNTRGQTSKKYVVALEPNKVYYEAYSKGLIFTDGNNDITNFNAPVWSPDNFSAEAPLMALDGEWIGIEKLCDWRELIYQMAKDYRKYNHLDDFVLRVADANPGLFPTGRTGYEQYYVDMEGFWRQLYCYNPDEAVPGVEYYPAGHEHEYWNKAVYESPENLLFWFDFLDAHGELSDYAVGKIGSRTKVTSDDKVAAIYYRSTPEIIYETDQSPDDGAQGYSGYSRLSVGPAYKGMFSPSTQGKSAKSEIDNLLYNHTYATESVSITSVPIYDLEPNKRIYIYDEASGIDGEYIPTKITIPLAYNGTMNITATRVIDRII